MLPSTVILEDHGVEAACLIGMLRERLGVRGSGDVGDPTPAPDMERLTRLAIGHEVVHLLYGADSRAFLPEDQSGDRLLSSLRLRSAWNLVLFRETVSLSGRIREQGIEVLFYKGLVLCDVLHGDLTTRPTRDIDILVRSGDFLRLRDFLLREGFTEDYAFPVRHARYYMGVNRESAYSMMLPDGVELNVEVQWAPVLPLYGVPFDNASFFERAGSVQWGGSTVSMPCLEDQFLLLLAHHGVSELWHSLKHLTDLAFFIRRRGGELDWGRVSEGIRRWGMSGHAAAGFALCSDLLGTDMPSERLPVCEDVGLLRRMRRRLLATETASRSQILPSNMYLQMRLTEGTPARTRLLMGYLRKWVSPGLRDLQRLDLPRALFPLYYVLKPFRSLYSGGR